MDEGVVPSSWNFLTNHAHVLVCLSRNPNATLRQIGDQVGITERATHRIIEELVAEGAIRKSRHGRGNHYELNLDFPLRHPLEKPGSVGLLLHAVAGAGGTPAK